MLALDLVLKHQALVCTFISMERQKQRLKMLYVAWWRELQWHL